MAIGKKSYDECKEKSVLMTNVYAAESSDECNDNISFDPKARISLTRIQKRKNGRDYLLIGIIIQDANVETKTVNKASTMKVTKTRLDEETINNLIETGNSKQIFQNAIQGMGRGQILSTVEEIQESNDVVKEIERKLHDLHQIYLDMAFLVEARGGLLDNIETRVSKMMKEMKKEVMKKLTDLEKIFELLIDVLVSIFLI
ncbi:hypothetical protein FXO38_10517 [Capsicum annuum]|nr:hypothetical protein FXO37_13758 [Capsicum annuum]KAF3663710.1 hypothetical protein FXO38_10517 [Capsicum annuum]